MVAGILSKSCLKNSQTGSFHHVNRFYHYGQVGTTLADIMLHTKVKYSVKSRAFLDTLQNLKYAISSIIKSTKDINNHTNIEDENNKLEKTLFKTKLGDNDKIKDFKRIRRKLPPNMNFPRVITSFPIYCFFVSVATLLTFNYGPSSKIYARMNKLEWHKFIESMSGGSFDTALTVYPKNGILVSPSDKTDVNKMGMQSVDDGSLGFNLPDQYNFLQFPSSDYLSEFVGFVMKQTHLLYEQLDIIYRPLPFEDYWAYTFLPLAYMIVVLSKTFSNRSAMKTLGGDGKLNEAMNEKFGEEHLVKDFTLKFEDVIGCDEAKMEIKEFVSYMKDPEKFERLNARIPTGAILHGPPGTGKTMLAKALATECGTKFFACSGSDFVQMFVGVGAARVRNLFETARKNKPAIIFIDEIDAVATDRSVSNYSFSEKESTLNQLLSEMDGFGDNKNIIVVAGTNKFNYLDKAILRPGRFDRHIFVGPPDIDGRQELFKYYMKPLNINPSLSIGKLSKTLAFNNPGYTGASIANICNEAAIIATREKATYVDLSHFDKAADRIRIGAKTGKALSHSDRHVVAVHEAGHAVVGWNLPTVSPLAKVTIVPRGSALGFAQYDPNEINFMSQQQLYDQLVLLFGGRAAEDSILNEITTSARDDIEKATKLAYQIIAVFGMDPDLKNLSFYSLTDHSIGFFGEKRMFGQKIGDHVDNKVSALLDKAYSDAKTIIVSNKVNLLKIAKMLEQRETIQNKDVEIVLGAKKFNKPEDNLIFPTMQHHFNSPSS